MEDDREARHSVLTAGIPASRQCAWFDAARDDRPPLRRPAHRCHHPHSARRPAGRHTAQSSPQMKRLRLSSRVDPETERAQEEKAIPAAAIAAAGGGSLVAWPLKAMIPMYIYPTYLGSFWNVIEANPTNVEYVIANVETGPGTSANSGYATHIDSCRAVGIKVLSYVDTNYAGIAQSTVEAEMTIWNSLYAVDGFFFDRVPNVHRQRGLLHRAERVRQVAQPRFHHRQQLRDDLRSELYAHNREPRDHREHRNKPAGQRPQPRRLRVRVQLRAVALRSSDLRRNRRQPARGHGRGRQASLGLRVHHPGRRVRHPASVLDPRADLARRVRSAEGHAGVARDPQSAGRASENEPPAIGRYRRDQPPT